MLGLATCSSNDKDPAPSYNIAGPWRGTWTEAGAGSGSLNLTIVQDGKNLSGTLQVGGVPCCTSATVTGTMSGNEINLNATFASGTQVKYARKRGQIYFLRK